MKKRVYISIPITGEDYSHQRFTAQSIAEEYRLMGWEAVTPFDVVPDCTTSYNESMGKCIEALLGCDMIFLCEGWQKSKGCMAELQVAMVYGMDLNVQ